MPVSTAQLWTLEYCEVIGRQATDGVKVVRSTSGVAVTEGSLMSFGPAPKLVMGKLACCYSSSAPSMVWCPTPTGCSTEENNPEPGSYCSSADPGWSRTPPQGKTVALSPSLTLENGTYPGSMCH